MQTPDKRCTVVKLVEVGYKLLALSVASFQTIFRDFPVASFSCEQTFTTTK
jgi:hypothetical protein